MSDPIPGLQRYPGFRFHLLDTQIQLDPDLQLNRLSKWFDLHLNFDRMIQDWQWQMRSRLISRPPWLTASPPALLPDPCAMPGPMPTSEVTPRPGEYGDVLNAITSLPPLQCGINNLKQRAFADLRRTWSTGGWQDRTILISFATIFVGTAASSLQNERVRELLLERIHGSYRVPGLLNGGLSLSLDFSQYTATSQYYVGMGMDLGRVFPSFMGRLGFGPSDTLIAPPPLFGPGSRP
jgi:hypothetical protein